MLSRAFRWHLDEQRRRALHLAMPVAQRDFRSSLRARKRREGGLTFTRTPAALRLPLDRARVR